MHIPGTSYRVIRPLGQGGMGEVFEVENETIGKRAAVKVLAREYAGHPKLEERMRSEARTLARLSHPNLVDVYDLQVTSDGRIFFVMELLDGDTLGDVLRRRGRLSPTAAVRVIAQALDGLAAAHSTKLVHRDIKPDNVFICRSGITKLLDFGIAKAIDASTSARPITDKGHTIGTPWYMAPEQAVGETVDARADIYAAGVVLWEAISGRHAFNGEAPYAIAVSKEEGIGELDPRLGAPRALAQAIQRACAFHPRDRFPTAQAFAAEIRRAVGEPSEPWALDGVHAPHPAEPATTTDLIEPRSSPTFDERARAPSVAASGTMEHTEQIEALLPVDRDAPTRAGVDSCPPATGPSGTAMLPAVAVQHAPTLTDDVSPSSRRLMLTAPSLHVTPPSAAHSASEESAARQPSALVVVAAFVVPVAVASAIGLFVLRRNEASSRRVADTPTASQAAGTSPAPSTPAAVDAGPSRAASAETAVNPAPPKTLVKTGQPVAPATAAATAAARTTEVAPPVATTPPVKKTVRPASGL